jgi:hypothetical protein
MHPSYGALYLGDERKVVITSEGLTTQSATFSSTEKWTNYIDFHEGAAVFLLFATKQIANVIPKVRSVPRNRFAFFKRLSKRM